MVFSVYYVKKLQENTTSKNQIKSKRFNKI